ncbi:hypothetical protein, variant [Allomyces macrogynus ATCC 38327]|uniref:FTP domain-containing protein n=1 Tax=Allomyces macrogynus (strain ATCC 38327) TaxID=578462 RepID=A0A0L0SSK0_ALLM3|nr:hypothetical protein, variant [Allomyces macrogynus ATCC 38327]|eukprot:KNE65472.1 hypothetical protein, variant [Allomyces macrogynus ATCC 38327]
MARTHRSARQFALLFLLALVTTHAITVVDAADRISKVPTIAYKTFNNDKIPVPPAKSTAATESVGSTAADPKAVATTFLTTQLQFPVSEFVIKNVVPVSNGMTAVYVRQLVNGIEVVNGDINLNINSRSSTVITVVEAKRGDRKIKLPAIAHKSFIKVAPVESLVAGGGNTDPKAVASAFLTTQLHFPPSEFVIKDAVPVSAGLTAVYARQLVNGLEVVNGDINLNVKNGQVISYGDRFYRGARPSRPNLGNEESAGSAGSKAPADAFKALTDFVGAKPTKVDVKSTTPEGGAQSPTYEISTDIAASKVPVKYAYVQDGNNIKLVYSYQVHLADSSAWYHGHVNAQTGAVEFVNDWVSDAKYSVLPVGTENQGADQPGGFVDGRQIECVAQGLALERFHQLPGHSWEQYYRATQHGHVVQERAPVRRQRARFLGLQARLYQGRRDLHESGNGAALLHAQHGARSLVPVRFR